MEKYLDPKMSGLSFDTKGHPGCLWGVLHVLRRSHPWNNVKKLMPKKKSGNRTKTSTMRYSRLTANNNPDTSEADDFFDADSDDISMRETLSSSTNNISRKPRGNMQSLPNFRSSFLRTYSIHHLDPSSQILPDEVRDDCGSWGCTGHPYPLKTSYLQTSNSNGELARSESFLMDDERRDTSETSTSSSPGPQIELKKRSFKDLKQKIKDVIKESRKDRHRISMDAIYDKVPYGTKLPSDVKMEMDKKLKESTLSTYEEETHEIRFETKDLEPIINKRGLNNVIRTQSLNESVGRYYQLLEVSIGKENKPLHSRSLKLTNESGASSFSSTSKAFERLLSLPNLERHQRTESGDGLALESPTRVLLNKDKSTKNSSFDEMAVVSVSEENQEPVDELAENEERDESFQNVQVENEDEAGFNYVKDVLKLSGFIKQGTLGTWYSPEQPLDPSLFKKLETFDYSETETTNNCPDHQLLFDMINEVLLEMHDKSFTYWPLALSSNCNVRPMPVGVYMLEEVWKIITCYLNPQPEFEKLDNVVVRDLSKNNGWTNLQFDSEYVGIEVEEMILDDLLDELLYDDLLYV